MSMNRWNYVEGNPINRTDPSGLCGNSGEPPCPIETTPTPPATPPSPTGTPFYPAPNTPTPSPILYDPCFDHPEISCRCSNTSSTFNFLPPTGGYLEGLTLNAAIGLGGIVGEEVVYDFATMTRASFSHKGVTFGIDFSGGAAYTGVAWGFNWDPSPTGNQIQTDYQGSSVGAYLGITAIPQVTGGGGYFQSQSSAVKGLYNYIAFGAKTPFPGEVVGYITTYTMTSSITRYGNPKTGDVDSGRMIGDILRGADSPFGKGFYVAAAINPAVAYSSRLNAVTRLLFSLESYRVYSRHP